MPIFSTKLSFNISEETAKGLDLLYKNLSDSPIAGAHRTWNRTALLNLCVKFGAQVLADAYLPRGVALFPLDPVKFPRPAGGAVQTEMDEFMRWKARQDGR